MMTPGFEEEIMKKVQDLLAGQAHMREEFYLLSGCGGGRLPRRLPALEGSKTSMHSVVPRHRALDFIEGLSINILESMGQAVIGYDLDRRIFYWNQHAERLFECPKEVALGSDILTIMVNPTHYDAAIGIIDGVKRGAHWTGQFPIELQTGKNIHMIVSVDPFYDDDGTLVGILATAVDSKPFFEIPYPLSEARHYEKDHVLSCSNIKTLATMVSKKVRSLMKTREKAFAYGDYNQGNF